ncbi:DUF922 domain-containing protein [Notoacmeibacter sp. MSK16QG-6]|uniref:DUF922 domain-containing protein n=1 Tax=Notoacmeibacter sp. MSK16QG-6 TaxID=2957982 RepID=UPI00209F1679|nr:DUF922 domain-containing protein [Notoacmeibacter sp. MSK16QG-6]MCP1198102.1 DUF922 domain-containing protein [Notoacmeibacter sp. MSK16QG-6]
MPFWKSAAAIALMSAALVLPRPASADVHLSETTRYYIVKGETGRDVVRDMARRGPRSGFLARDIAQTWYSPRNEGDLVMQDGICRVRDPGVRLHIRYTYPRLSERADPQLQHRWTAFIAGVQKHEGQHAALAVDMARKMDDLLSRFAMRTRDRHCGKAKRELARRMDAIWKEYDVRQNAFDKVEHRRGGEVDKLVRALTR